MSAQPAGASNASRRASGAAKQITRQDLELAKDISRFYDDPLGFVLYAFPWGRAGTRLADEHGPDEWQIEVLEELGNAVKEGRDVADALPVLLAVASGHGIGKGLQLDTVIPTPAGYRRWGDLQAGDQVFGRDGAPTNVIATYPQPRQMIYRVAFDDGSYLDVDGPHLWNVKGRQQRRTGGDWITIDTAEILRRGVKRANGKAEARQWEIPAQEPAQYSAQDLLIEPYLFGMWLGNGSDGSLANPLQPEMQAYADQHGITRTPHPTALCETWRLPGIGPALEQLGLKSARSWEKRIPELYLIGSVEQRRALLAGLLDTDGTINKAGAIVYDTTSPDLAEGVIELVRSLGGKAQLQPTVKDPFYRNADGEKVYCRPCYRVTVRMPVNPFRVASKGDRWRPCEPRYLSRWIDSIEPIGDGDSMCITVDAPDALYQTKDFIVTHNTAAISWIILWFIATREFPQIVVTAGKREQLQTKTWRELAKWQKLAICGHWFVWTTTKFEHVLYPDMWAANAIAWSKHSPENFAGTHEKHVLVVMDEASAVDDVIWEVTDGAMTTAGAMWIAFGNPTKNTGRFFDCFNKFRNLWRRFQIDSRTAKKANRRLLDMWVKLYGEDSDFVRVRVRGVFPRAGDLQFISSEDVQAAIDRTAPRQEKYGKVLGVDVARHGHDKSVFAYRQGRKMVKMQKMRIPDTMQLAARVAEAINDWQPDAVFVDATGIGWGVVDRLHQMGYTFVIGVQTGERAFSPERFYNRRAELWYLMREWIQNGGDLPDDKELFTDLTGIEYGFDGKNRWVLESKEDMKERGLDSPDAADALALTFHSPVAPTKETKETWRSRLKRSKRKRPPMAA